MAGDRPEFLLPDLDDNEARPFWNGCEAGELRVQHCDECGLATHPPRPMCPRCRSITRAWRATSGRGSIWSYVVAHPPLLPAYAPLAPYNVIVVALDEDPALRFVGNLVAGDGAEINSVDPATIAIGQRVRVSFATVDDVTLPRWVRA
jgi:hypothetical protein